MPTTPTARSIQPPSRDLNPFATCWTRVGALPFRYPNGQNAHELVAKLASYNWRCAIMGSHGSGKSTLLESLKPAIIAVGRVVHSIALHNRQRELPPNFLANGQSAINVLFIIDGYEQLGWRARLRLWRHIRLTNAGLLVTSHAPVYLPTLIHLAPDQEFIEQLVDDLITQSPTTITRADIAASHACHGSNVREILFDLYDRHEIARRNLNPLTSDA